MKFKSLLIIFLLMFSMVSCSDKAQQGKQNANSQRAESIYSVKDAINLATTFGVGEYSDIEYSVTGYLVNRPSIKNNSGYVSFTITDDLANPESCITVFMAIIEEDIHQNDQVVVKAHLRYFSATNIMMMGKLVDNVDYNPAKVTSVECYGSNAETSSITVLDLANYVGDKAAHYPISDEFIEKYQQKDGGYIDLAKELGMEVDRQKHEPNQKWHLFESWLGECLKTDTINWTDEAKSRVYTKLLCPELLLWLFEAIGANPKNVRDAMAVACASKVNGTHISTSAKNMRACVTWEALSACLMNNINAMAVTLDHNNLSLNVGDEAILVANVVPENTTNSPSWQVLDGNDVIRIDAVNNQVTLYALKEGVAKVRVSYNVNVFAECVINVIDNRLLIEGVNDLVSLKLNDTHTLNPTLNKGEGIFEYTAFDNNVISVDNGVVTALNYGYTELKISLQDNPEVFKTLQVYVSNYGAVGNAISVNDALTIGFNTCLNENDISQYELYIIGQVKEVIADKMVLVDLELANKELLISNYTCDSDVLAPNPNDIIVVKGYLKKEGAFLLEQGLVLDNEVGQSLVTLNSVENARVYVNENEFNGTIAINNGEVFSFKVAVDAGFIIQSVLVNNQAIISENDIYSFVVKGDMVIDIQAVDPNQVSNASYQITYDLGTRVTAKEITTDEELYNTFTLVEGSNLINSVSDRVYIYGGANGGRGDTKWYTGNILKFGTTSVNGTLTFNLSSEVNYVKITGYVYDNGCKLQVGDTLVTCSEMNEVSKEIVEANNTSTMMIEFTSTKTLTIATTNKKPLFITSIEFGFSE